MIANNLTEKQSKFFNYFLDYAKEHGHFPSYKTVMGNTWINSKNGVLQYMEALVKKRYLQSTGWGNYELHPSKRYLIDSPENPIPIRGIITAGVMLEAIESDLGSLSVRNLFPQAKNPFCLRVSGTSMEGAGIYDGDLVIMDDSEISNGDIGAVLFNDETTLKEIHIEDKRVILNPKSQSHSPIELEPDEFEEVRVLGKYVAHFHEGRVQYLN